MKWIRIEQNNRIALFGQIWLDLIRIRPFFSEKTFRGKIEYYVIVPLLKLFCCDVIRSNNTNNPSVYVVYLKNEDIKAQKNSSVRFFEPDAWSNMNTKYLNHENYWHDQNNSFLCSSENIKPFAGCSSKYKSWTRGVVCRWKNIGVRQCGKVCKHLQMKGRNSPPSGAI